MMCLNFEHLNLIHKINFNLVVTSIYTNNILNHIIYAYYDIFLIIILKLKKINIYFGIFRLNLNYGRSRLEKLRKIIIAQPV